jgi:hypothetical protein
MKATDHCKLIAFAVFMLSEIDDSEVFFFFFLFGGVGLNPH